ncbi:hypothetical protein OAE80_01285 [Planctomycetaceae bacterium]|nr:hypothetical protein [Planctomycetaceae bacterium]
MSCFNNMLLVCLISIPLGCGEGVSDYDGPKRVAVSGEVMLDGEPVPSGMITFIAEDSSQRSVTAGIGGGNYNIPEGSGPNLGAYKVKISSPQPSTDAPTDEEADYDARAEDEESNFTETIPANYNADTELTVEIKAGANTHNFDLDSE